MSAVEAGSSTEDPEDWAVFGTELGADFEVAGSSPGGVRSEQGRLKPLDPED